MLIDYVIADFFNSLDARNYEKVISYFDDESSWERKGALLKGREEIKGILIQRNESTQVIHQVTNLVVEIIAPDVAKATYLLTAYEAKDDAKGRLICHRKGDDELRRVNEKWIFSKKSGKTIMWF